MIIVDKFDCGCRATEDDGDGNYVALKTQDSAASVSHSGWKNVIHYVEYCNDCYKQAVESGCVAMTEEEEMNWLRGDML